MYGLIKNLLQVENMIYNNVVIMALKIQVI